MGGLSRLSNLLIILINSAALRFIPKADFEKDSCGEFLKILE